MILRKSDGSYYRRSGVTPVEGRTLGGISLVCTSFIYAGLILDSFLVAVFIYSIQIVYDTAQSVYVILDYGH
jgi:hypothetical protein